MPPNDYWNDRRWAMNFDDHVQLVICKALRLVSVSPAEDDMRRNSDFQLTYRGQDPQRTHVAARVRRHVYAIGGYRDEITFRESRPSGRPTEWPKMLAGHGDFMVYGFAEEDDPEPGQGRMSAWAVINLHLFRQHVEHANRRLLDNTPPPPRTKTTHSGETFIAWQLLDLASCPRCLGIIPNSRGHMILDEKYVGPYLERRRNGGV